MPKQASSSQKPNKFAPRLQDNDFFDQWVAAFPDGPTKDAFATLMHEKSPPNSPRSDAHHSNSANVKTRHPKGRPPSCG